MESIYSFFIVHLDVVQCSGDPDLHVFCISDPLLKGTDPAPDQDPSLVSFSLLIVERTEIMLAK
jgi:hypothetical protein